MTKANELLGYTYSIQGRVVHGKHLGTGMGFPTVNLLPPSQKHLPAFGVYLSEVEIDGKLYPGITNIGRKPTIKGEHPAGRGYPDLRLDKRYLWECDVKVRLLTFMRPEKKFDSVEDLKAQVLHDKEEGRIWHQNRPEEASNLSIRMRKIKKADMQDVPIQGEVLYLPFDSVWPL